MILAAAFSAFFLQAQPVMLTCASATAQGASGFTTLVCAGEREAKQGEAAQKGTADARRHFENAVEAYRKAEAGTSVAATRTALLEILARLYDAQHLNEPAQAELVFRELAGINPDDLTVLFRLSRAEEDQASSMRRRTHCCTRTTCVRTIPTPTRCLRNFLRGESPTSRVRPTS